MKCAKCKKDVHAKAGFVNGKQRYRCKECNYFFTKPYPGKVSPQIKQIACILYINGLGFRRIGHLLGVSNVSVLKWVRKYATHIDQLPITLPKKCSVIEIDEMWHYIGKKNRNFGFGLLIPGIEEKSLPMHLVLVDHAH